MIITLRLPIYVCNLADPPVFLMPPSQQSGRVSERPT